MDTPDGGNATRRESHLHYYCFLPNVTEKRDINRFRRRVESGTMHVGVIKIYHILPAALSNSGSKAKANAN